MAEQDTQDEVVDVELERNRKVSAMMEAGFYDDVSRGADYRTAQDGGVEGEELPLVRAGEVYESMAAEDDDVGGGRRRVRVAAVDDDRVRCVNVVTGAVSHVAAVNLVPPKWRRAHS